MAKRGMKERVEERGRFGSRVLKRRERENDKITEIRRKKVRPQRDRENERVIM